MCFSLVALYSFKLVSPSFEFSSSLCCSFSPLLTVERELPSSLASSAWLSLFATVARTFVVTLVCRVIRRPRTGLAARDAWEHRSRSPEPNHSGCAASMTSWSLSNADPSLCPRGHHGGVLDCVRSTKFLGILSFQARGSDLVLQQALATRLSKSSPGRPPTLATGPTSGPSEQAAPQTF